MNTDTVSHRVDDSSAVVQPHLDRLLTLAAARHVRIGSRKRGSGTAASDCSTSSGTRMKRGWLGGDLDDVLADRDQSELMETAVQLLVQFALDPS